MKRLRPVAFLALLAATGRLLALDSPGSVSGKIEMTEKVRARAGTVLVLLEPVDAKTQLAKNPAKHQVKQRDAKFIPSFLVVTKGDSIEFTNDEPVALEHNVYSFSDPKKFDLGLFGKKGDGRTVSFDTPGEVAIFCSVHKFMEGTVYVAPTAFFATADARTGEFQVKDVPPGSWKLRTWSSAKRYANEETPVTVKDGATATVTLTLGRRQ